MEASREGRTARKPQRSRAATIAPPPAVDDPSGLQILIAEHYSLSATRSLVYNEAFTRGNMFLGFVSMSFVALALIAQAIPVGPDLLLVAAVVLVFDLVVGLTSFGRILAAGYEDYRAVHGMARIRHRYAEVSPDLLPYLEAGIHDDLKGVMRAYGSPQSSGVAGVLYGLTTSAGMMTLILAMLGGVLAYLVVLLAGGPGIVALMVAAVAGLVLVALLGWLTYRYYMAKQAVIPVMFPTPLDESA